MILRLLALFALASSLLVAKQQQPLPDCSEPESEKLSQQQVKALIQKTEPIHAPCCADMLHISGTIVLTISVDSKGEVTCVQVISGHPLIVGVAIDSVRAWKFQSFASEGTKKSFCGTVALRFKANEHSVKYRVI
jgi:outer membrane biosynthesis protein TonB